MKKILQRIGLLAAAVLLLWGWQGMNAKADDYTGNWTVDRTGLKNCHIMLSTMIDSKMYDCFSIYPGDDSYNGKEYWFLTAPKVVYSTDDVNEIEASATYDSVQQCYYYRLPNHGTGKIVMTGEAVNLEFHSSLSEPAQLVSNDEKSYFLYDLIQFMNTLMYVLKIINIARFFLCANLLKRDPYIMEGLQKK